MVEWLKQKAYPPTAKWKRIVDHDGNVSGYFSLCMSSKPQERLLSLSKHSSFVYYINGVTTLPWPVCAEIQPECSSLLDIINTEPWCQSSYEDWPTRSVYCTRLACVPENGHGMGWVEKEDELIKTAWTFLS